MSNFIIHTRDEDDACFIYLVSDVDTEAEALGKFLKADRLNQEWDEVIVTVIHAGLGVTYIALAQFPQRGTPDFLPNPNILEVTEC